MNNVSACISHINKHVALFDYSCIKLISLILLNSSSKLTRVSILNAFIVRRGAELSKVPNTFYDDCREYIEKTTEEYKKTLDPLTRRVINNSVDIIQEINNYRYDKIVHAAATGKELKNMVGSERSLYDDLNETFTDYKRSIHNPQELKEIGE